MTKKLTITKRKSISECNKLWKEIEESELPKYGFLDSSEGEKWRNKGYQSNCPLCEYVDAIRSCHMCPLVTQYNKLCEGLGFLDYGHVLSTPEWFKAIRGLK